MAPTKRTLQFKFNNVTLKTKKTKKLKLCQNKTKKILLRFKLKMKRENQRIVKKKIKVIWK